jgi:DNA helicase II / ATP-dependent DNA helicase PcrA
MQIIPSPEQQLCIDAATSSSDNLLITACAGGAKTTTMCQIARAVGPGRRIVALAFNKDAATSLAAKVPYYVESKTFHSFCYDALGVALKGKPRPDGNRCKWFLKDLVPDWKQRSTIESEVLTLVSRFKSTTASSSEQNIQQVADDFGIDAGPSVLALAKQILDKCLTTPFKSIDFDDMLWLAYHLNVEFPAVSLILLDEAQDTNPVQRALLDRMCNRQARLIAVGDPHQSIYGFRGASANAMEALRDDFAMRELALSVSYRCSQAVVTEAQKYL